MTCNAALRFSNKHIYEKLRIDLVSLEQYIFESTATTHFFESLEHPASSDVLHSSSKGFTVFDAFLALFLIVAVATV